ncbi:MAG: Alkaline phosphatase synthesis sensor protein PhoR, partial [Pseudomonadota bacterium]
VLVAWWAIFAGRLIDERAELVSQVAELQLGRGAAAEQVVAQHALRAQRQRTMLVGEGAVFGAMLVTCLGGLFLLARRARMARERLTRLLQFTTHELKTPIAGVQALLQSLQLGSIPEAARAELISQGLQECGRLEHLAETILAYQRAAVRERLVPVPAAADALVSEVLEHRRKSFGTEEVRRSGVAAAEIRVDPEAFRVVLENLLDNARKYGGGDVELRADVELGRWRLALRDRGQGFEPALREQLFQPFERSARGGMNAHGSGLGLFISRQLVQQMGGELSADSAGPGQGATFTLEFPVASSAEAPGRG